MFRLLTVMLLLSAPAFAGEPAPSKVDLVAARAAVAPGGTVWLALRQQLRPGWHSYWRNPGDAGEATTITWRLPEGVTAGPVRWPLPERFVDGPVVSFGYQGEVLLPIALRLPAGAAGTLTIAATADYVVCAEICIPETAEVALRLPIAAQAKPTPEAAAIAAARAAEPKPFSGSVAARLSAEEVELRLAGRADLAAKQPWFLAHAWGVLDPGPPLAARTEAGDLVLRLRRGDLKAQSLPRLDGVLVWGGETPESLTVSAPTVPMN